MSNKHRGRWHDTVFFLTMGGLSSLFVLLIALLLIADLCFTSFGDFREALANPRNRAALKLTLLSCTVSAVLSLWAAVPLGYLLARYRFPGRWFVDTFVDIPIVLPPLVLGLSLLILFHQPFPLTRWLTGDGSPLKLDEWFRQFFPISFSWRAVVIAQFAVSCAFAVRTMRVTFEQITPRGEDVARTLGCSRAQAFLLVAFPQAWKGMIAAFTIAWARALGEFGPILVFAGSMQGKTEVLSTTVFLELSIGQLDSAVAISLLMVAMAIGILFILRGVGGSVSP